MLFAVVTFIGTARPKAAEQWHVLVISTEWRGGPACFKLGAKHKKLQFEP